MPIKGRDCEICYFENDIQSFYKRTNMLSRYGHIVFRILLRFDLSVCGPGGPLTSRSNLYL